MTDKKIQKPPLDLSARCGQLRSKPIGRLVVGTAKLIVVPDHRAGVDGRGCL
jgi:hypothetical protein